MQQGPARREIQVSDVINAFGKKLIVIEQLGFGLHGSAYLVKDETGKKFTYKKSNGENMAKEAEINKKLGRLYGYEKGKLLLEYIDGFDLESDVDKHIAHRFAGDITTPECTPLKQDYYQNPQGAFKSGLHRNLVIAIKMIEALERLHSKNIVHTDAALRNFVIKEDSHGISVELIDFGIVADLSRLSTIEEKQHALTQERGKFTYGLSGMIPEMMYDNIFSSNRQMNLTEIKSKLAVELARHIAPAGQARRAAPVDHHAHRAAPADPVHHAAPARHAAPANHVAHNDQIRPAIIFSNSPRNDVPLQETNQQYLERCIREGKNIGARNALVKADTRLTSSLVNKILSEEYRRAHPKTARELAEIANCYHTYDRNPEKYKSDLRQAYLGDCISRGAQKGALCLIAHGAYLDTHMIAELEHPNYKVNHPKCHKSLTQYIKAYYNNNPQSQRARARAA